MDQDVRFGRLTENRGRRLASPEEGQKRWGDAVRWPFFIRRMPAWGTHTARGERVMILPASVGLGRGSAAAPVDTRRPSTAQRAVVTRVPWAGEYARLHATTAGNGLLPRPYKGGWPLKRLKL